MTKNKTFAIAFAIREDAHGSTSIRAVVGVFHARSEEEALGAAFKRTRELMPTYGVISSSVMEIERD